MKWMMLPLKRFAQFEGRSRRRELWMFVLLQFLVVIATASLSALVDFPFGFPDFDALSASDANGAVAAVAWLRWGGTIVLIVPNIAVATRRLHDQDLTGRWLLVPPAIMAAMMLTAMVGFEAAMAPMGFGFFLACLVLLILMVREGTDGPNRFGNDPKAQGVG